MHLNIIDGVAGALICVGADVRAKDADDLPEPIHLAAERGHAAVVEQLLSGGWLEISEMNFYWNGGGWGRVDYRYVHVGPGVSFIF